MRKNEKQNTSVYTQYYFCLKNTIVSVSLLLNVPIRCKLISLILMANT